MKQGKDDIQELDEIQDPVPVLILLSVGFGEHYFVDQYDLVRSLDLYG